MTAMILQENNNATERTELNDTQIQQKSRLQQFLLILDQKERGGNSLRVQKILEVKFVTQTNFFRKIK